MTLHDRLDPARFVALDRLLVPSGADPRIGRYAWSRLVVAHNLRERVRFDLARLSGACGAGWLVSGSGRRPTPGQRADLDLLREVLRGQAGDVIEARTDAASDVVLLGDYPGSERRRGLVFVFGGREREPVLVIKLRHAGGAPPELGREKRALDRLHGILPPEIAGSIPRVLAHERVEAGEALLLTAIPGRSAYNELYAGVRIGGAAARHLQASLLWLSAFQQATAGPAIPLAVAPQPGDSAGQAGSGLGAFVEAATRGIAIPRCAAHGDFWPRNVLFDPGSTMPGVVDWEASAAEAPPWHDLYHFVTSYGLEYPWRRRRRLAPRAAMRATFLEKNAVSDAIARGLRAWAGAMDLEARVLEPLFHDYLMRGPLPRALGTGEGAREMGREISREMWAGSRTVFPPRGGES